MITKISGVLVGLDEDAATLSVPPFEYEVLIPDYVRRQLQAQLNKEVKMHTLDFLEGNAAQGGRLTPRLVGFLTEPERQFFELFCSVDGVGVKKALRAMVRPVKELAILIESQDTKALSSLPGVGPATSERVVAKLRRKMPRFALMVGREGAGEDAEVVSNVARDAFDALLALGHSESDARQLIDEMVNSGKKFKDVEALLTAIYQKRKT
ncbi:Holliday junction branch migration protein RuvA [Candidatus Laterigemmans baculatus]|uniref:Holliday junction branch migration protein RuvA n=1 Tax=Candidatus Laterigemmans baculatus TaxID=2770505 RepID=UPI0013DAE75E|nr:Holliday junction branch migration protein RuvA [Candidatus Laterigemmans baculatus]